MRSTYKRLPTPLRLAGHALKQRVVPLQIEDKTVSFYVPTHITRTDDERRSLHGWQVRYAGKHKFFADSGNPEKSFADSINHLEELLRKTPK